MIRTYNPKDVRIMIDGNVGNLVSPEVVVNVRSHREFARSDDKFQKACERANISATSRQASKWRRKMGKAYMEIGRFQ